MIMSRSRRSVLQSLCCCYIRRVIGVLTVYRDDRARSPRLRRMETINATRLDRCSTRLKSAVARGLWRQPRRGCRGHIPQYFGWGTSTGISPNSTFGYSRPILVAQTLPTEPPKGVGCGDGVPLSHPTPFGGSSPNLKLALTPLPVAVLGPNICGPSPPLPSPPSSSPSRVFESPKCDKCVWRPVSARTR